MNACIYGPRKVQKKHGLLKMTDELWPMKWDDELDGDKFERALPLNELRNAQAYELAIEQVDQLCLLLRKCCAA